MNPLNPVIATQFSKARRVPRVKIGTCDTPVHIQFPDVSSETHQVRTIAELGAQFFAREPEKFTAHGSLVRGFLQLASKKIPVQARVVIANKNSVAVEFMNPPEELRRLIQSRFQLELRAASLKAVITDASTLYCDGQGNRLEIKRMGKAVSEIDCRLHIADLKFNWDGMGDRRLMVEQVSQGRSSLALPIHKRTLLSFIRNLPELDQTIRRYLEDAIGLMGVR